MIDVFDLGIMPRRVGHDVVPQRRRNVDEASSHACPPCSVSRACEPRAGYSFRVARRTLRNTLAASAAGNASVSMRPASQPGADAGKREHADEGDHAKDGRRQKLVIDEQTDQFLDDCADHASAAALGLRSTTSPKATARNSAIKARIAASPPGHSTPRLSPVQNRPKAESIDSDREFERVLRHARERPMDRRANAPRPRRRPPTRPRSRGQEGRAPPPMAMTMNTTSIPSSSTALNAVTPAIQSNPRRLPRAASAQFARLARKGGVLVMQSDDSDRAQDRLAQPAQAEHEQSTPTTNCKARIGTAPINGPRAATMSASAASAAAAPVSAGRQPRASPTASTMVSASTASTNEAANAGAGDRNDRRQVRHRASLDLGASVGQLVRRASDSHKPPPMRTVPESRPSNLTRDGFMNQARPMPAATAQAQSESAGDQHRGDAHRRELRPRRQTADR